jgi:glycosyltransferase involved in cell wall biosynthesis
VKPLAEARTAIVHEWLVRYAGGYERVIENVCKMFPEGDHFALVHKPEGFRGTPLEDLAVRTSFIQSLPGSVNNYRAYLPLMPLAVERFNLSAYDIIISNSHAVAKGVITSPDQLHVCYLQARNLKYAYEDRFFYPHSRISGLTQDFFLSKIRVWDAVASKRPDFTIANSRYVKDWHVHRHGIRSRVIYPPVDVAKFSKYFQPSKDDYYVTVGRLEPYKRVDLIVKAFNETGLRLVVVGEGTMLGTLKRMVAPGSNIEFMGHCESAVVARVNARARAFVFASREDFGIAPLEAQACGTPVIAYGRGGALETVIGWPASNATGVFFDAQTPEAIEAAVRLFDAHKDEFKPEACRSNAKRFGQERFRREFRTTIGELWGRFQRGEGLE